MSRPLCALKLAQKRITTQGGTIDGRMIDADVIAGEKMNLERIATKR